MQESDTSSPAPAPLPAPAARYIRDICAGANCPACIRVDRDGRIESWGGPIEKYIPAPVAPGMAADDFCDLLSGMLPPSGAATVLPMVETGPGKHADFHLVPDDGGWWVILLDSSEEARRLGILQQHAHELALRLEGRPAGRGTAARPRAAGSNAAPVGAYGMIGRSAGMLEVYELIADVAAVDSTVLILGETGTGKELVARAIHSSGARKDRPFVVVNCAGLSDSLINSQLFGHKKGSFTDAVSDQKGFIEAANGGTLLLDEIGDIPMNTQTRILRALEQKEIIRIGETVARTVDVRVLAATHKDLDEEVRRGAFREDLLYRIRVARIHLPPLRARRADIPLVARFFLDGLAADSPRPSKSISQEAMDLLLAHDWPGNVRELRNAIEFAVIRCRSGAIQPAHLPPEVVLSTAKAGSVRKRDMGDERRRILSVLEKAGGRRDEAARLMGVSRATLYRRMKACGLDPERRAGCGSQILA